MGAFQIIFVLVNIAIPVWLLMDHRKEGLDIEWGVLAGNIERMISDHSEMRGCSPREVSEHILSICQNSYGKMEKKRSFVENGVASEAQFACRVSDRAIAVHWRPKQFTDEDIKCQMVNSDALRANPEFTFDLKGRYSNIYFTNSTGEREFISVRNCRLKLRDLMKSEVAKKTFSEENLLQMMPAQVRDPSDALTANQMCLHYDPDDQWDPFRTQIRQLNPEKSDSSAGATNR